MSTWRTLDEEIGLWAWEQHAGPEVLLRATVVRMVKDALMIVSPVRDAMPDAAPSLAALGRPRWLLAPNHYHNLGLASHLACFPEARVVASEVASRRLRRRIDAPITPIATLEEALPEHVRVLAPPGTRTGEVWLRVETARGVAWVVTDAFFNFVQTPPGFMGRLMWALQNSPGLRLGGSFKWIALGDRQGYAAWLRAQLDADPPSILIPAHGAIDDRPGLAERLRALVDSRLP